MVDFVKEGKVGDKVKSPTFGKGEITGFNFGTSFPVIVSFNGNRALFKADGRCYTHYIAPTLCFENGNCEIDQGTPPVREPEPLVFTGDPVWAYVGDNKDGYEFAVEAKSKRQVIAQGKKYLAIADGASNTESSVTIKFKYAWPVEGEK